MKVSECRRIFEMLSEYLDRDLPDDVCQDIDSHIAGCSPCVEFVESLKKSMHLCRSCKSMDEPGPLDPAARDELYAAYKKAVAERKKTRASEVAARDRGH